MQPSPSLAYVAFYSDIEHEVLKVTSGSRVTLTYNLYLVPHDPTPGAPVPSNLPVGSVKPNLKDATNFQATLHRLLKSPEFMPEGGTLAFNLAHLYPITFDTELQGMIAYLKGEDAHVHQSCRELELKPVLRMIYSGDYDGGVGLPRHGVMMEVIIHKPDYYPEETSYERYLVEELEGIPVNLHNDVVATDWEWNEDELTDSYEQLTWLTDFTKSPNELKDIAPTYGNEVTSFIVVLVSWSGLTLPSTVFRSALSNIDHPLCCTESRILMVPSLFVRF